MKRSNWHIKRKNEASGIEIKNVIKNEILKVIKAKPIMKKKICQNDKIFIVLENTEMQVSHIPY